MLKKCQGETAAQTIVVYTDNCTLLHLPSNLSVSNPVYKSLASNIAKNMFLALEGLFGVAEGEAPW